MTTIRGRARPTLAAVGLAVALTALGTGSAGADNLEQTVHSDEEIGSEQVVLESGHVDIGPRIVDGSWQLLARDDTKAPPVWRYLDDVVMHVTDAAVLPSPDEEVFSFIDAEPGSDVHVIPQTENTEVVWVGWNTQDPPVVEQLVTGVTLRLHGVEGPGQLTVFLQSGNFDPPQLLWDSQVPEPQDIFAVTNTHVHGNWVFTEPGVYLVDVEVLAETREGPTTSARSTLRFAVGDIDPQEAFAATGAGAEATDATSSPPEQESGSGDAAGEAEDGGGLSTPLLVAGAAVVLIGALTVVGLVRSRRARREAEVSDTRTGPTDG